MRAAEPLLPAQAICRMEWEEFNTSTTVLEVEGMELEGWRAIAAARGAGCSRHPRNAGKLALEDVKAEPAEPEMSVPEPFNNVFQMFKAFLACSAPHKKKEAFLADEDHTHQLESKILNCIVKLEKRDEAQCRTMFISHPPGK
eukprot:s3790_g15.t1